MKRIGGLWRRTCKRGGGGNEVESFFRDYLIAKKGEGVVRNSKRLYGEFKKYREKCGIEQEDFFVEMRQYGEYYSRVACGEEKNDSLLRAFTEFKEINIQVASFLLLSFYAKYMEGIVGEEDLEKITRLIESYVFRRWVCDLPPNARHSALLDLTQKINAGEFDGKECGKRVASYFLDLEDTKRFPNDKEFQDALRSKRIYDAGGKVNYCKYLLDRLAHHGRSERVEIDRKQIEHVMPQKLTDEWKEYLGTGWKDIHATYVDKLGNLTLTSYSYNPKYSNKLFLEKRDMKDGYKDSPFLLNRRLAQAERWNKEAMEERGKELAEKAVEVWISAESLAGHKE